MYKGTSSGVYTTSALWSIEANQTSAYLGTAVAGLGDVNNDGYADIAVSATGYDDGQTDEGEVFVFHGSSTGPATAASWSFDGDQTSAGIGTSLAGGDVDGDGYSDLAIGAQSYDHGSTDEGTVWVFHGSSTGLSTSADWSEEQDEASAYFGQALACGGDVNDDGYDDLIVGAYGTDATTAGTGAAQVYHGSSAGLSTSPDLTFTALGSNVGYAVAAAGDPDGDGYDDVLVSAYASDGSAWLLSGGPDGASFAEPWDTRIYRSTIGNFGYDLADAGDVNNDGYDDVIVGCYNCNYAYVYHGAASGLATTATSTLSGTSSTYFGYSVDGAGDVNGDGYDDVVVGAQIYTSGQTQEGAAYVFYGAAAGVATSGSTRVESNQTYAYLGSSVAGVGDVNGDGYDDIAAGAPSYDNGETNEGVVLVFKGAAAGLNSTAIAMLDVDLDSAYFGSADALSGGDVNGDGYADVLVGAYNAEDTLAGEGGAWVFLGSASGTATAAAWEQFGEARSAQFGTGVAVVGDLNGDGYEEIAVGAPGISNGHTNEGRLEVFAGSASGPATSASWSYEPNQASAAMGSGGVGPVGDLDGDGYDDLAVGIPAYDGTYTDEGAIWVYLGSATGPSASTDYTITLDNRGDSFAAELSGGGDIGGDGGTELLTSESPRYTMYVYSFKDGDGDGELAWTDCDDGDASIYTGASELCDGVDNDCDGRTDETIPTWYHDADGDGYGDAGTATASCTQPASYVSDDSDCDDADASLSPAATEACDGVDNDCDGSTDENGASGATTWFADADGDSYGNPASTVAACSLPAGYVSVSTDCDDTDAGVNPGASEYCDGEDDDCDGTVDESAAVDASSWYADADGDGFGGTASVTTSCSKPTGFVATSTDCNDGDAGVSPGASESCDGEDDDCDGTVDDGVASLYAIDADGDGYGDPATVVYGCSLPSGYAGNDDDCNDADATVRPGASEACNYVDDDCDGSVDEGVSLTLYADADSDGYGDDANVSIACALAAGTSLTGGDCDDADAAVSPGAAEVCNDADDNCEGTADEGVPTTPWYLDADGDGFGGLTALADCAAPAGYVGAPDDCDDTDAAIGDGFTWYADEDEDGYGDPLNSRYTCDADPGYLEDDRDCDDARSDVHPYTLEVPYDGVDQDCDGASDYDADGDGHDAEAYGGDDCEDEDAEAFPGGTDYPYDGIDGDCDGADSLDGDGDGHDAVDFGGDDCDDGDAAVYPGAPDDPYDGRISDCDPAGEYDADGDGERREGDNGHDCDDDDANVNSEGTEVWYDGVDQDCDGNDSDQDGDGVPQGEDCDDTDASVTEGCSGSGSGDTDDTGSTAPPVVEGCTCSTPGASPVWLGLIGVLATVRRRSRRSALAAASVVTLSGCALGPLAAFVDLDGDGTTADLDCDDANPAIHPEAEERCDEIDNDCDGAIDDEDDNVGGETEFFRDEDDDGHGHESDSTTACLPPKGFVADNDDCDDNDPRRAPSLPEVCDADHDVDEDCDGQVDDEDEDVQPDEEAFVDTDGDGYGVGEPVHACDLSDYASQAGDCDDDDRSVHPEGNERCDSSDRDEDCNGLADDEESSPPSNAEYAYADLDGDGYGYGRSLRSACDLRPGETFEAGDCMDSNSAVHPDAEEVCGDRVDQDCDGSADGCAVDGNLDVDDATGSVVSSSVGAAWGWRVSAGGDSDGDGVAEAWIAGALVPGSGGGAGAASLLTGMPVVGADTALLMGVDSDAATDMVYEINGAGDLDGDGLDDLVVASPYSDRYTSNAGYAYVFLAPFEGRMSEADAWTVRYGYSSSDYLGFSVATGDWDADGQDDVVWTQGDGNVYIEAGPLSATASSAYSRAKVRINTTSLARVVMGDANGDGQDDLAVGQWDLGDVYFFEGGTTDTSLELSDADGYFSTSIPSFGWALSMDSDLNRDGEADLVIGGPDAGDDGEGDIGICFNPPSGALGSGDFQAVVKSSYVGAGMGYSLAGGGDLNGDGFADLAIGAPQTDEWASEGGAVWVYTSPMATGTFADTDATARIIDRHAGAAVGIGLGIVDLDADGYAELLTGGTRLGGFDGGGVSVFSPEGI